MNLNHLAIFRAVAVCQSVSAAARSLHITQSAVSKQLGEFEQRLGVQLFDRRPRGMQPTEAGRLLLGYAQRLFAIEAEAEAALGDLHAQRRGRLALGASRTLGGYLLPPLLAAYRERYPGVELSLRVENTQAIEDKLVAGEIDIGFSEGIIGNPQLSYAAFARDELVLVAAPGHAVAGEGAIALSRLAQLPLLLHEPGSGTRAVTERALEAKGLSLRPAMTLASTEAIKQTVAAGTTVAILSTLAVRADVAAGRLRVIPLRGLRIHRPLYRVQLRHAWNSPALSAFLGLLEEHPAAERPVPATARRRSRTP
jgi:DNA-binding transcriptional LysR family regulator